MEELRKLEQVQRTLSFLESHGFFAGNNDDDDSNRFIANLTLLFLQPCGKLDFEIKCSLISQHLPRITPPFLEEASRCIAQEKCTKSSLLSLAPAVRFPEDPRESDIQNEGERYSSQSKFRDTAMVGLNAMQRANSTLEDFCRSYFMFHGMDVNSPQVIFKYLPMLSFTESYIYQLDRLNEKILDISSDGVIVSDRGFEVANSIDVFPNNPFKPLMFLLEQHGVMTERIKEEFSCGSEYWALERKLCWQLMNQQQISIEDAMRAIQLKSFDYRVLNLILYQLRQEEANDLHMEFLSMSEFLVEISDDLFDYEDDVLENNFNIFRMFIRVYGPATAPAMLAKCITDAEEKYNNLLKSLDPHLSLNYQRRCEEATKEGGKSSGNPFGTWSIPPVIVDEESYRSNLLSL